MVVNAMLVAMVAHANQPGDVVYHVGSSVRNPVTYLNLQDYGFNYFKAKPWINKDGKTVKVGKITVLTNMDSFQRYMFIRYLLPIKVLIYISYDMHHIFVYYFLLKKILI
jgi:fatty acyl-CoA reductase